MEIKIHFLKVNDYLKPSNLFPKNTFFPIKQIRQLWFGFNISTKEPMAKISLEIAMPILGFDGHVELKH